MIRRLRRLRCFLTHHDPILMWFGDSACGSITGRLGCRRCRVPLVWGVHGRVRSASPE